MRVTAGWELLLVRQWLQTADVGHQFDPAFDRSELIHHGGDFLVAASGEGDGGGYDQSSTQPGEGA